MPKNHDIYYVTKYKVQEGNTCLQSTKVQGKSIYNKVT